MSPQFWKLLRLNARIGLLLSVTMWVLTNWWFVELHVQVPSIQLELIFGMEHRDCYLHWERSPVEDFSRIELRVVKYAEMIHAADVELIEDWWLNRTWFIPGVRWVNIANSCSVFSLEHWMTFCLWLTAVVWTSRWKIAESPKVCNESGNDSTV